MRLWILVTLGLALGACDRIDCFDDGPLEAAYLDGQAAAQVDNRAAFDRGKVDGLALTRADGQREGAIDGYADGFADGYDQTYSLGVSDGLASGSADGANDPGACDAGQADGYAAGQADGYQDSYDAGFDDGASDGYGDGYADGSATCDAGVAPVAKSGGNQRSQKPEADPGDKGVCRDRGYQSALDPTAYDRGLAEGKRENPDFQAGYRETYAPAYDNGVIDGMDVGYDDGFDDGYAAGYDASYQDTYDACFDGAYGAGYDDGAAGGYDGGYGDGYDAGYSDGYSDGSSCEGAGDNNAASMRPRASLRSRSVQASAVRPTGMRLR
jgi:flagellar biosynthesis/type III secretory pathway protein FliH